MKLAEIADRIAAEIYHQPIDHDTPLVTTIYYACIEATSNDLPPSTLNRLTDMVEARLRSDRFWKWRHGQMSLKLAADARARGDSHVAVSYERSARQWLKLPRLGRRAGRAE